MGWDEVGLEEERLLNWTLNDAILQNVLMVEQESDRIEPVRR